MPVMNSWVALVVLALAVTRATGLVVKDDLTAPLRNPIAYRLGVVNQNQKRPFIGELVTCPWCASMWIAAFTVAGVWLWHDQPWLWCLALIGAFSQIAGMLSDVGRK